MVNGKLVLKNKILLILIFSSFLSSLQINNHIYNKFKNGDIIFRRENNTLSNLFAKINSSYYSHSGIIFFKNHIPYVIHVEGGLNSNNDLHIQTLKSYLINAKAFLIMRYKRSFNQKKFFQLIDFFSKKIIEFDFDFKLNNNKLYCTEFVNYFYYLLTHKNLYVKLSKIKNNKVIIIKNLINSPFLTKIYAKK